MGEESLVGVCLERDVALLPALLGVHKAGAAYLPLDPELPRERLATILEDARPQVVLAEERWRPLLAELLGGGLGASGGTAAGWGRCAGAGAGAERRRRDVARPGTRTRAVERREGNGRLSPPRVSLSPASLAYVLFTSGSTGRPKGVAVPHGALMNVLGWVSRELGLEGGGGAGGRPSPELALLAVTTLSFDIAAVELLLPLLLGGRVELAGREVAGRWRAAAPRAAASGGRRCCRRRR